MSDWNLFVREARPGNFRGNRSLAMRSLSRGARSKHCRLESGSKHGRGTPAQTAKPETDHDTVAGRLAWG